MSAVIDLAALNVKKAAAQRTRAEWILSLSEGYVTTSDLIRAACTEQYRALTKLTLRQVLVNQPGWGEGRAKRVLSHMLRVLDLRVDDRKKLTVAWLVDSRAGGRRVQAWADSLDDKSSPPWPGFPHAPNPREAADV